LFNTIAKTGLYSELYTKIRTLAEKLNCFSTSRRIVNNVKNFKEESEFRRDDGKVMIVIIELIIFGNNKKGIVSMTDITAIKKYEWELQKQNFEYASLNEEYKAQNEDLLIAKEKAEESDRLKSAFLANMSHEIRTPMNGIIGFADLLKELDLTGEEQREYIQIIEKSGERMLNIINEIISISKIESGTIDIHISDTNINKQVKFVYNSLKLDAEKKGLNLSYVSFFPEHDAVVKTDSDKLYGILSNLVKNAIKYTNEGEVEFGCIRKGLFLEFYIKDTGIGIHKEKQQFIFDRFIQADIENIMARQGAGLGLAIAKAYVEKLGGRIWVESEEGVGSVFYFTLPYQITT